MLAELGSTVSRWLAANRRVIAATLVGVDGSAPFAEGQTMLIADSGEIEGSVTGGCVETAVFEEAQRVLAGERARVVSYGVSDETAAGVGLTCGGTVDVLINELSPDDLAALIAARALAAEGAPVALVRLITGGTPGALMAVGETVLEGSLAVSPDLDEVVARDARGLLQQGLSGVRRYGPHGQGLRSEVAVHIHAHARQPRLVMFGAVDFSAALIPAARLLGYRTTLCDARAQFLASRRFRDADERVGEWPDRYLEGQELGPRDVVLVLTHDPKFDIPAIRAALASGAGFVGALGSRRTHADRARRLRDAGVSPAEIASLSSPCGLDIGARTPAETAVSILAEVIARRSSRPGTPLREGQAPIHPPHAMPTQLIASP